MNVILPDDGRQSVAALAIRRGAARLMAMHGMPVVPEVPLPNGRRADLVALGRKGEIWMIEIKSSVADFRADAKWPEYRPWCDRLFFAVGPEFPSEILPESAGLLVCDSYGGAMLRDCIEERMAASARKAITLAIGRVAAARVHLALDPDGAASFEGW